MTLIEKIKQNVSNVESQLVGSSINLEALEHAGICVVKNALEKKELATWQSDWDTFYTSIAKTRKINQYNPVDFIADVPEHLLYLYKSKSITTHLIPVLGDNIGLFSTKLLVKDQLSSGSVFLHQDYCYQHGTPNKFTTFVALNNTTTEAGVVRFYLGTHKFGYLGDAGELNSNCLGNDWPIFHMSLKPGDMVIMNCQVWHDSTPNLTDKPRVILGTTYQNADEFGSTEIVEGTRSWDSIGSELLNTPSLVFNRSRTSRLKQLEAELELLKQS